MIYDTHWVGNSKDVTFGMKVKLVLAFIPLMLAMLGIFLFGLVAMEIRNAGRWLNLFGEWAVGEDTFYKDLIPLTFGQLWTAYKEFFGFGQS